MPYSQQDEEGYILASVPDEGRFLDIGAWHPRYFSNTRALYEKGWGGVLIEPSPGPFLNLMRACCACAHPPLEVYGERKKKPCEKCGGEQRYGDDPKLTLVLAAVAIEHSIIEMHASDDALTTSSAENLERWKEIGGFYGKFRIPAISWHEIHNNFGHFEFVNIDAEGVSAHLFFSLMDTATRPNCICVEHEDRLVEIQSRAAKEGYKILYTSGENLVMAL